MQFGNRGDSKLTRLTLAAANPHCATAGQISFSGATSPAPSAAPVAAVAPVSLPASLSRPPFVMHIASAGAAITDLGVAHGMLRLHGHH